LITNSTWQNLSYHWRKTGYSNDQSNPIQKCCKEKVRKWARYNNRASYQKALSVECPVTFHASHFAFPLIEHPYVSTQWDQANNEFGLIDPILSTP